MKTNRFISLTAALAFALQLGSVCAELGDNNPTGPAGRFNGNFTTAWSYDPLTGNMTRGLMDIVVPGALGYPLAFTRTMNSRFTGEGKSEFGRAGTWRHNYEWSVASLPAQISADASNPAPTSYDLFIPMADMSISAPRTRMAPTFAVPWEYRIVSCPSNLSLTKGAQPGSLVTCAYLTVGRFISS